MTTRLTLSTLAACASALAITGCATPRDLDLTLQHASQQGRFVVRLEPPANGPVLHQLHAWRIQLHTPDGAPVSQARIGFDGGMPQHGHGFPTRPRVTRELGPGVYALEGMKFSMTGWWDMRLSIQAAAVSDTAVFNVVMTPAGLQR